MKIYLAGTYSSREALNLIAEQLKEEGHDIKVPAIWLTGRHDNACPMECATSDIADIKNSDLLLLFTNENGRNGGRYVELGIALALGIPAMIVGKYTNVFTRLCRRVNSVGELLNERTSRQ